MSIIYSKTQDGTINVLLAGKVTRDSEVKKTGDISRVKFPVCYDKKQYMDCEAFADSDVGAVAGCLEKGDTVAVMGKYRTWEYNGKTYKSVTADFIFTLAVPQPYIPEQPEQPEQPAEQQTTQFAQQINEADYELPF